VTPTKPLTGACTYGPPQTARRAPLPPPLEAGPQTTHHFDVQERVAGADLLYELGEPPAAKHVAAGAVGVVVGDGAAAEGGQQLGRRVAKRFGVKELLILVGGGAWVVRSRPVCVQSVRRRSVVALPECRGIVSRLHSQRPYRLLPTL